MATVGPGRGGRRLGGHTVKHKRQTATMRRRWPYARPLAVLSVVMLPCGNVHAAIDFSAPVHCTYQKGQVLTPSDSGDVVNRTPMVWHFSGLLSENPVFQSGGDTGAVTVHPISHGVSIYLPFAHGVQTFTVFNSGVSFWNKQYDILGQTPNSQQYVGTCSN